MDIIISIQAFRGKNGKFLPKEIAVADIEGLFLSHWVLNAPYPYLDLSTCWRETNNRLTTNHHGIEWHDGDAEITDALHNIRELSRNVRHIFMIGAEETAYLQILCAREIINLDTKGEFKNNAGLSNETTPVCYLHVMKNKMANRRHICALRTVLNMRQSLTHKKGENNQASRYSKSETEDEEFSEAQAVDTKTPICKET
ncbi:uncharacterized protein [Fopius arisanus]|uniref:Uncharacterized protein n=1 Tax=Fopius arisanus TaxID=64838 RepID=A0A9R1TR82_9HYME|nr:PREDICTED: uncharacterized protein LOC105272846 [Fopius arisanus]